jgi:hypothetical protein
VCQNTHTFTSSTAQHVGYRLPDRGNLARKQTQTHSQYFKLHLRFQYARSLLGPIFTRAATRSSTPFSRLANRERLLSHGGSGPSTDYMRWARIWVTRMPVMLRRYSSEEMALILRLCMPRLEGIRFRHERLCVGWRSRFVRLCDSRPMCIFRVCWSRGVQSDGRSRRRLE